jgi:hypothetical protein
MSVPRGPLETFCGQFSATYTVTRTARRPGRAQEEDFLPPPAAVTDPLPPASKDASPLARLEKAPVANLRGVVGSLAARVLSDPEWRRLVSPRTRDLCLSYLRDAYALQRTLPHPQDPLAALRLVTGKTRGPARDLLARCLAHQRRIAHALTHARWMPPYVAPRRPRAVTVWRFLLPHRPWETALVLSTVWGLASRTLRLCARCGLPHVTRECETCRFRAWKHVTWLSGERRRTFRRVVFRLRSRTRPERRSGRAPLTQEECDRVLRQAAQETRTLRWSAWCRKWDAGTALPRGRRRRSSTPLTDPERP